MIQIVTVAIRSRSFGLFGLSSASFGFFGLLSASLRFFRFFPFLWAAWLLFWRALPACWSLRRLGRGDFGKAGLRRLQLISFHLLKMLIFQELPLGLDPPTVLAGNIGLEAPAASPRPPESKDFRVLLLSLRLFLFSSPLLFASARPRRRSKVCRRCVFCLVKVWVERQWG